jgi:hypothetical protein
MKKISLLSICAGLALVWAGCKKESMGTKPQLTFNSFNQTEVIENQQQYLNISFQVKDSDGDLENGCFLQTIFDSRTDTANFDRIQMPGLEAHKGSKLDAEVILHLTNINFSSGNTTIPDSVRFRVYIEDDAGNKSDTVLTPKLPLIKQ